MAADYALFIGWGGLHAGREQIAIKSFGDVVQYLTSRQQQGDIESFEPVILEQHGGELAGFFLVKGEAQKLNRIRAEDEEFRRHIARATLFAANVGVVGAAVGSGVQRLMQTYNQEVERLEPVGAAR